MSPGVYETKPTRNKQSQHSKSLSWQTVWPRGISENFWLTLVGDSLSWNTMVSIECTEWKTEQQSTENAQGPEKRHGSDSRFVSVWKSCTVQLCHQSTSITHRTWPVTLLLRAQVIPVWLLTSRSSPYESGGCLKQALGWVQFSLERASCVELPYVGVNLQRSANKPLLSSLQGGAEAMLSSYCREMLEEIIFMVVCFWERIWKYRWNMWQ